MQTLEKLYLPRSVNSVMRPKILSFFIENRHLKHSFYVQ